MKCKELSKKLPATIAGHRGQLTIMKRNNETYYCLYPETTDAVVPVMKGKSIDIVLNKMHKALVEKNIIGSEKKNKKRKLKKKIIKKPMSTKKKLEMKLKIQNRNLKNK